MVYFSFLKAVRRAALLSFAWPFIASAGYPSNTANIAHTINEISVSETEAESLPSSMEELSSEAEKTVDTPRLVEDQGGFYVITTVYSPKIPQDLPKDEKPSQYLKKVDVEKVEFVGGDTAYLWIGPKWQGEIDKETLFSKGSKISFPVKLALVDSQKKEYSISGYMLLEAQGTLTSTDELDKQYPPKNNKSRNIYKFNEADGSFIYDEVNDDLKFTTNMIGGPIEQGWSSEAKKQAVKFYAEFYEALGCFIASAVYHSWKAPELATLRKFRDVVIKNNKAGSDLLIQYYRLGPKYAAYVKAHPELQKAIKPFLSSLVWALESSTEVRTSQTLWGPILEAVNYLLIPWLKKQNAEVPFEPLFLVP